MSKVMSNECFAGLRLRECCVAVLCLAGMACAMYSPSDDVIELDPSSFSSKVLNSDALWLVEFYAPWYDMHLQPDISTAGATVYTPPGVNMCC